MYYLFYYSFNYNAYIIMIDLDEMIETMSDKDIKDYFEICDADMYCCSSDCLEKQYLDAGI